ncbi:triacylglycerol lipase, putative [Ricinus communis]|uniref:Phospholipase A1 n=1 Tax=Ricinus communis TaxID=3988 RepID=B9S981_RICCO|nr:triacylglycerol lipase, putative [Ricinus communis]
MPISTREILAKVGLQIANPFEYQVTDYIYARSDVQILGYVTFIEFVAEEEIFWLAGEEQPCSLKGLNILPGINCPHQTFFLIPMLNAFHNIYTSKDPNSVYSKSSAREQVLAAVRRVVDKCYKADPNEAVSITVIGHRLGGSLATLNAMDIVANGYNKPTGLNIEYPVTAFVYAGLRVGNRGFLDVFSRLRNLHLLRINNAMDPLLHLPPEKLVFIHFYEDVGVLFKFDTKVSPYIKGINVWTGRVKYHDFNLYLHGIAGYKEKGEAFHLVISLDLALVNKYNDLLKDDHNVPPKWWSNVMNKGMIQMSDGSWKLLDYMPDPPKVDVSDSCPDQ